MARDELNVKLIRLRGTLDALRAPKYLTPVRISIIGSVAAAFGGQLILVISGIALARLLGPVDRGYMALLLLWPGILYQILDIGLPWSLTYHVASGAVNPHTIGRLVAAPFAVQCVVVLLTHLAILLAYLHGKPVDVIAAGAVTLAIGPSVLASDYALAVLQGLKSYASVNLFRLLPNAMSALVAVTMLIRANRNLVQLALLLAGAYAITAVATMVTALQRAKSAPHSRGDVSLRRLVAFGLRGYLGSLYPLDAFRLDQVIVGLLLTPISLGVYVVGSSFTNLPRFLAQSIGLVAFPQIASTVDSPARRSQVLRFFIFGTGAAFVTVLLVEGVVGFLTPLLFGDAYNGSVVLARILLVGALCLSSRRVLAECLKGAGFPFAGTVAEVASWLVLAPALVLLLRNGAVGVAWAVALSFAGSLVVLIAMAAIWAVHERRLDKARGLTR
jgi:O-antigen/teichoic acid export membrane protein